MTLVKQAARTYLVEFVAVAVFYTLAVIARPYFLPLISYAPLRLLATVLPVVAIWLMFLVVVRFYRHVDEREKLKLLEKIAVSSGILACLVTTLALIEDVGLPRLALTWAWPTLAITWAVATGVTALRNQ